MRGRLDEDGLGASATRPLMSSGNRDTLSREFDASSTCPDGDGSTPEIAERDEDEPSRAEKKQGDGKTWWLVGLGLLAVGAAVSVLIYVLRPQPEPQEPPERRPLVDVTHPDPVYEAVWVQGHGVTEAVHDVALATEVSGRVTHLHPAMRAGGAFERGDVLLRVEQGRYRTTLAQARAELRATRASLDLAELQRKRTRSLARQGVVSRADLDEVESRAKELRARLNSVAAQVEAAKFDLDDTTLTAPFDGRVREVSVGPGHYVTAGSPVVQVYPSGTMEVEVRLSPEDAALLGPSWSSSETPVPLPARVSTIQGDETATWTGVVVRTSSNYDPQAQTLGVVVAVENPDPQPADDASLPLLPGRFVDVSIAVSPDDRLLALDPEVLRGGQRVWIVENETLQIVPVEVVYRRPDRIYVRAEQLDPQTRLVTSDLDVVAEGMSVRLRDPTGGRGPA